jgi:hypothetical protein
VLVGDPGEEVESSIILMVPFADMVNHSPDNQVMNITLTAVLWRNQANLRVPFVKNVIHRINA